MRNAKASLLTGAAVAAMLSAAPASAGDLFNGEGGSGISVAIGAGVLVQPTYEGSDEYEAVVYPLIFPSLGGTGSYVEFDGIDDLRFKVLNFSGLEAGPLVGYNFGRDEDDGDLLEGLGDVDGGLLVGGFVGYRLGILLLDASYHTQVTGEDEVGAYLRFGAKAEAAVSSNVTVNARVGATYADADYMQSYFGVTAAQAANSGAGLAVYDPDAGIKDVHLEAGAAVAIDERWTLRFGGRYAHLIGDAADSPVVADESQLSGTVGVTYKLDLGGN